IITRALRLHGSTLVSKPLEFTLFLFGEGGAGLAVGKVTERSAIGLGQPRFGGGEQSGLLFFQLGYSGVRVALRLFNGGAFFRQIDDHFILALHPGKEGAQSVVVVLADGVSFVVVTAAAAKGQPQEGSAG